MFKMNIIARGEPIAKLIRGELQVSLEVDLNPPEGFVTNEAAVSLLDGRERKIPTLDLPSLMAGKMHILLTRRDREKGRDWYDYNWYRDHQIKPNLAQLGNAIRQTDPKTQIRLDCWGSYIRARLKEIRWPELRRDVAAFLENTDELSALSEHVLSEKTPTAPFELLTREIHEYAQRSQPHPLHWDPSLGVVLGEIKLAAESGDGEARELLDAIVSNRPRPPLQNPHAPGRSEPKLG